MSNKISPPKVVLVHRSIILDNDNKFLLIQRAASDPHHPNLWEFPGGKLDKGQDISNALEREILEETNLFVMLIHRLAYFESYIIASGKYKNMPHIILIGISKLVNGKVKLSGEHQNFVWTSKEEALTFDLTDETRKAILSLEQYLS